MPISNSETSLIPWPNPAWKENPYQKLLYAALRRHRVEIRRTPPFFSWLKLPWGYRADWLHLNWPEQLYASRPAEQQPAAFERVLRTLVRFREKGGRLVWTFHNRLPHDVANPEFHRQAYGRLLERCDLVHVHFPAGAEYLQGEYGLGPEKILIMPHGHYGHYYGPRLLQARARALLGLPSEGRILLAFGYLRRYKGILDVAEVFHRTSVKELHFLIAGTPEDEAVRRRLLQLQAQDARFLLKLHKFKEREIAPLFSAADAFIFPSREFFTSGSVMLALTYRLPVVAGDQNHLQLLRGRPFFKACDLASSESIRQTLEALPDWLASRDASEFDEILAEWNWERLAGRMAERLKSPVARPTI